MSVFEPSAGAETGESREATQPTPESSPSQTPQPKRRSLFVPVVIAVNLVAIIVAIVVIVSMNGAVEASIPPPPTDEELFEDMRATPLDVNEALLTFADQAALITTAGGVTRSQTPGVLVLKGDHAGSHECMALMAPTLDEEHAWSTRGVWPSSAVKTEVAITTGVQVFPTTAEASESFGLLAALADGCGSELETHLGKATGGPTLNVDEEMDGSTSRIEYLQVGNAIFITKGAWAGSSSAVDGPSVVGSALQKARTRIADFAEAQLKSLRDTQEAADADG